jgi:hypothetical protein
MLQRFLSKSIHLKASNLWLGGRKLISTMVFNPMLQCSSFVFPLRSLLLLDVSSVEFECWNVDWNASQLRVVYFQRMLQRESFPSSLDQSIWIWE